jgi:hypothetical protein
MECREQDSEISRVQVVGKAARKTSSKNTAQQPPAGQMQRGTCSNAPQLTSHKRCPSATSLSESMCSAESRESDQSAAGASGRAHGPGRQQQQQQHVHPHPAPQGITLGQFLPHRPAHTQAAGAPSRVKDAEAAGARPKALEAPPRIPAPRHAEQQQTGVAAGGCGSLDGSDADTRHMPMATRVAAASTNADKQEHSRQDTWAGKVAGAHQKLDADEAAAGEQRCQPASQGQPSRRQDPVVTKPLRHHAAGQAASGQPTALGCPVEPARFDPETGATQAETAAELGKQLRAARADAEAARRESARLAVEVERLRSALAQSAAARQQEVGEILQSAAAHQAAVQNPLTAVAP